MYLKDEELIPLSPFLTWCPNSDTQGALAIRGHFVASSQGTVSIATAPPDLENVSWESRAFCFFQGQD